MSNEKDHGPSVRDGTYQARRGEGSREDTVIATSDAINSATWGLEPPLYEDWTYEKLERLISALKSH